MDSRSSSRSSTCFERYKPLTTFGGAGLVAVLVGFVLGTRVVIEFLETGMVPRIPTAILATGLVLTGFFGIAVGLILNTLSRSFKELQHQILAFEKRLEVGNHVQRDDSRRGENG